MKFWQAEIAPSKSLLNRALIVQSFAPNVKIHDSSSAADVYHMQKALLALQSGLREFDCGDAGTVLRFLALRVSREEGTFYLRGSERLFRRPQNELVVLLSKLGIKSEIEHNCIIIQGGAWLNPRDSITVSTERSSQFLSAILLSAWNLNFDLKIQITKNFVSQSYFHMTYEFLRSCGMKIEILDDQIMVHRMQKPQASQINIEQDMSSAFSIAALGSVGGKSHLIGFPQYSIQPDFAFVEMLKSMGVMVEKNATGVTFTKPTTLKPISISLKNTPDLLPVLSVICALAEGESVLKDLHHTQFKESPRLKRTQELLGLFEINTQIVGGDLHVNGDRNKFRSTKPCAFDPDQDHRMAFAVGVAQAAGLPVSCLDPQVVRKSFPDFWQIFERGQQ